MSILGIGIDIVQIDRMQNSIDKHGDAFVKKILHPNEQKCLEQYSNKSRFLAKRFAAKEAFAKALGTGIADGVSFPLIEVFKQSSGQPMIQLHASTADKAEQLGINQILLSISDEKEYAVAQVLLSSK